MHTEDGAPLADAHATAPPSRRRWLVVLLAVLLVLATAAAVTTGLIAADQRDAAAAWQARAAATEQRLDEVVEQRDDLAGQRDEALAALSTSEADVATLEDRVRALAEEKARAEDTASTVAVERDVLLELSEVVSEATTALDSCVTRLFELQDASVAAFNAAAAGRAVDVDALNERSETVTAFCDQARTAAADAEAAADRLRAS